MAVETDRSRGRFFSKIISPETSSHRSHYAAQPLHYWQQLFITSSSPGLISRGHAFLRWE